MRAEFHAENGQCEVELSFQGKTGAGRAGSGQLFGGAEATLAALRDIGFSLPFYLLTVVSVATVRGWPVIVTMRPFAEGADMFGIAQAESDVTSSAMATLDSLNRFLSKESGRLGPRSQENSFGTAIGASELPRMALMGARSLRMTGRAPACREGRSMTKILVVDDDQEMTKMLEKYLSNEGYQVTVATTGAAALVRGVRDGARTGAAGHRSRCGRRA